MINQTTFFLKLSWRISLTFLGILFTVIVLGVIWAAKGILSINQDWWVFITLGIFLLLSLSLVYQGMRSRLVLTRIGITYYQPHFKIQYKWNEVEKIVEHSKRLLIIGQNSAYQGNSMLKWGLTRLGPWDRIIPIDPYLHIGTWRDSEFGILIEQHAPHLLS